MSRAPFVMPKAETAFAATRQITTRRIGWRFVNPLMKAQYGVDSMPETGRQRGRRFRRLARRPGCFRCPVAAARRAAAQAAGIFPDEIVPVS
jgi:acetyl-CoA acetyltransferase